MNAPVTTLHRFDALEDRLTDAPDRVALYADAGFATMLADRLDQLLKHPPDMILSLDVFDTLLLRDNSAEVTRFVEFGAAMAEAARRPGGSRWTRTPPFLLVIAARGPATAPPAR